MSWFDWLLIGGLAVLFVLALRHIIRQAKKGRCCGCSGCGGCEGCPSRSGCEEGLGRLEHEEDADSGRSAGQSAAGCRSGGAAEQKHPKKKGGGRMPAAYRPGTAYGGAGEKKSGWRGTVARENARRAGRERSRLRNRE